MHTYTHTNIILICNTNQKGNIRRKLFGEQRKKLYLEFVDEDDACISIISKNYLQTKNQTRLYERHMIVAQDKNCVHIQHVQHLCNTLTGRRCFGFYLRMGKLPSDFWGLFENGIRDFCFVGI